MESSLKLRSVNSIFYNISAQGIVVLAGLVRSIVLARLLLPEMFGVYALCFSIITITLALPNAAFSAPLLFHARESEGEVGASTHFSLNFVFTVVWAIVIGFIAYFGLGPLRGKVMGAMVVAAALQQLALTRQILWMKSVNFKRIALYQVTSAIFSTVVSIYLAKKGFGIWSLVSVNFISAILAVIIFNLIKPGWKVKLIWNKASIKYYFRFGGRSFIAGSLGVIIDNVDNIYANWKLGSIALGYYSKAFEFGTYPRNLIARPFSDVIASTYAELHLDRDRLSRVFVLSNGLLIRLGFAVAGVMATTAPEFVEFVIGPKWLPMLTTFRILLIYTMFDPLRVTVASVLIAVGCPELVAKARGLQFITLVIGLIIFTPIWGISGIAIAVNLMLFIGIAYQFKFASKFVDFSIKGLFMNPLIALACAILFSLGTGLAFNKILVHNVLGVLLIRFGVFTFLYVGIVWTLDGPRYWREILRYLNHRKDIKNA